MFDAFLKKIEDNEPFSFIRFGDGEFGAIFNSRPGGRNCDGHEFFPDMGEALTKVLVDRPKYYLGMQRFAQEETHPVEIAKFLKDNDLENLNWINADLFHHASIKGYFEQFFDTLNKRDEGVILVAPGYLKDLGQFNAAFVEVPEKNCWLDREIIMHQVRGLLQQASRNVVVLFVASMPSNYMIDVLYKEYGQIHTFLDMGSVFDPFVGKKTRGYHSKVIERLKLK